MDGINIPSIKKEDVIMEAIAISKATILQMIAFDITGCAKNCSKEFGTPIRFIDEITTVSANLLNEISECVGDDIDGFIRLISIMSGKFVNLYGDWYASRDARAEVCSVAINDEEFFKENFEDESIDAFNETLETLYGCISNMITLAMNKE